MNLTNMIIPIGLIFLVLVIIIMAIVVPIKMSYSLREKKFSKTNGRILKVEHDTEDKDQYFINYYEYLDASRNRLKGSFLSYGSKWKEGDVIEVYYNPNNPLQSFTRDEIENAKSAPQKALLGFMALIVICVAVAVAMKLFAEYLNK